MFLNEVIVFLTFLYSHVMKHGYCVSHLFVFSCECFVCIKQYCVSHMWVCACVAVNTFSPKRVHENQENIQKTSKVSSKMNHNSKEKQSKPAQTNIVKKRGRKNTKKQQINHLTQRTCVATYYRSPAITGKSENATQSNQYHSKDIAIIAKASTERITTTKTTNITNGNNKHAGYPTTVTSMHNKHNTPNQNQPQETTQNNKRHTKWKNREQTQQHTISTTSKHENDKQDQQQGTLQNNKKPTNKAKSKKQTHQHPPTENIPNNTKKKKTNQTNKNTTNQK